MFNYIIQVYHKHDSLEYTNKQIMNFRSIRIIPRVGRRTAMFNYHMTI